MKVAEALAQVKDVKGKIRDIQNKISREAYFRKLIDEQEVPSSEELINEFKDFSIVLSTLKDRIAKTNVESGLILKIHEMERLRYVIAALDNFADAKKETITLERIDYDMPAKPFTTYATFDVDVMAAYVEDSRIRLRKLDMEVQQLNWTIDLVE